MINTLLQTKLYTPPTRPNIVPRTRLLNKLNAGLHGKLTMVSAPAGFGKTTVTTAWLSDLARPVGWVSLDEDDSDPQQFFSYVAAATRPFSDISHTLVNLLQSPQPLPTKTLAKALVNDLAAVSIPCLLVLDDYHMVKSSEIDEALTFLLDHMPPNLHLVVTSRSEPSLPLSRLRARRMVTEILADELRFTAQEAATFFNEVMGLRLSQDNIHALEMKTEGWITGLQMAALSLQRRDYAYGESDIEQFIDSFTGSHRYVFDYLADEVLAHLPAETKQFLWQTAVLNRLSAPLCAAVTGQADSQLMLETLDNANLFIIPLDDQRRWYRYHHLFQDLLRHRLETYNTVAAIADLHLRASNWFKQNGYWDEAFDHLCAAEDMEKAVHLIRQRARTMLDLGEISLLLKWVTTVPETHILQDAELALYLAWATYLSLQWDRLDDLLTHIEQDLESSPDEAILCEVLILRGSLARYRGQAELMRALFRRAKQLFPAEQPYLQGSIAFNLGLAHIMFDEMAVGLERLQTAVKIFELDASMWVSRMFAMFNLAQVQMMLGQLSSAKITYQTMLQLADQQQQRHFAGLADVGLAWLYYAQNELGTAKTHAEKGERLSQVRGAADVQLYRNFILARIYNAQGDKEAALASLREGESLLASINNASLFADIMAETLWFTLLPDGLAHVIDPQMAVVRWQAENIWLDEGSPNARLPYAGHLPDFNELLQVRLWLRDGRFSEAQSRLQTSLLAAEAAKRIPSQIEIKIVQAIMFQTQAQSEKAQTTLQQACQLAQSEQLVRLFVDEGQPIASLLQTLPPTPFQRFVLAAFAESTLPVEETVQTQVVTAVSSPPLDALSQRELEVLRLIASGLSNRQTAEKLVVAPGTVKKHLENIYSKLDVHSRTEAVRRATERNLI